MILGVDVSRYQSIVDWDLLKSKGVEFAIVKATQGNYSIDPKLAEYITEAHAAGMIVGAYHWCDPTVTVEGQAKYFLNNIQNLAVDFVAADVEQQWADWNEWKNRRVTNLLSPQKISDAAKQIISIWEAALKMPVVIYTRTSFVEEFAKPMESWLAKYSLWLAYYPYKAGAVSTSWDLFLSEYKPQITGPALPPGCTQWTFWQFTGGKFILPGVDTAVDVNYFNGTLDDLKKFAGIPVTPTEGTQAQAPAEQPASEVSSPTAIPDEPAASSSPDTTSQTESLSLEERVARLEAQARAHGWDI
ncbi:MAG TPA: glycoside hydrolase family 25 protein [Longilinea sp.]|nr:glycoside hydrolase family 25 protein [Longilinea sp.]